MKFQKGNNFWTKRSKHGRDKIFKTPDELWQAACEYFDHVDNNPFEIKKEVSSGSNKKVEKEFKKKPYTLMGLCIFCNVHSDYWREFKKTQPAFSPIIKQIEEIIYSQKFNGAASGLFNNNIIARDLGLADKKETEAKHEIKNPFEGLSLEQLEKLTKLKDDDSVEDTN